MTPNPPGLASRIGGDRIAWRIAATVLLGILCTQAATILLLRLILPSEPPQYELAALVREVVADSRQPKDALIKGDDRGDLSWEAVTEPPGFLRRQLREAPGGRPARGDMPRGDIGRGPPPLPWPLAELELQLRAALPETDFPELQVRPMRPRPPSNVGLDIGPGLSVVIPWQQGKPGESLRMPPDDYALAGELKLPSVFAIWLRHADGQWYLVRPRQPEPLVPRWLFHTLWLLSTVVIIAGLTLWTTARLLRPLHAMANTAREWQAEAPPQLLPETGPAEFRAIAQALNGMQGRIHRFVHDRASLVAALSHDLRTPLTRLRLRLESPDSPERRQRMLDDLAFMERLTDQLLSFAALDARGEPEQRMDIGALLASLCDDAADAGSDARYDGPLHVAVTCRPTAVRRALTNLIDNALKYGSKAHVDLRSDADRIEIRIRDAGPGIPEAEFENVLAPFYRLDAARNIETGGLGMGLAVAASILRAHGGDIRFRHPPEGGFETIALLPLGR